MIDDLRTAYNRLPYFSRHDSGPRPPGRNPDEVETKGCADMIKPLALVETTALHELGVEGSRCFLARVVVPVRIEIHACRVQQTR